MNELGNTPADKNYKPSGISRAESRALEVYPYFPTEVNLFGHKTITADGNSHYRGIFIKGYKDAEKDLRAEIERRMKNPHITFHARGELLELLSFLDTPESEKPDVDLEKEIERRYDQAKWGYVDGFGAVCMDKDEFVRIARHFAIWGAEHLKK